MRRYLIAASILTLLTACDKARDLAGGSGTSSEPAQPETDISGRPDVLFHVFGERTDPRMIPIAIIRQGRIDRLSFGAAGWRRFDSLYTRSGARYALFSRGQQIGTVTVRQGMWERSEPLYSLPGCRVLTPLAAVSLDSRRPLGFTVEFLATSASLGRRAGGQDLPPARVNELGRQLAIAAAARENSPPDALSGLEFRAYALHTGTSTYPTLLAGFLPGEGSRAHVLTIGERSSSGEYSPSYVHHTLRGGGEYRRFLDHLDLDGDGIHEIILEGWSDEGGTFLTVLAFQQGQWREVYRSPSSWCLDRG